MQTFSQYPHQPVTIASIPIISNRIKWIQFKWLMQPTFPLLCDSFWQFHHAHWDKTHSRDSLRTLLHYISWTYHCCTKTSHVNHIKHTTHANKCYGWVESSFQLCVHILTSHHYSALSNQIKHKPYYFSHVYTSITWCTSLHQLEIAVSSLVISSEQPTCTNYYYVVEPTPVPIMNCCT